MQIIRINNRLPTVYRIARATPVAPSPTRTMSLFSNAFPFGPRHSISSPFGFPSGGDFAPLFRLLDDYAKHTLNQEFFPSSQQQQAIRSFQPRFDVKETQNGYELHGELPGLEANNVEIEFTDATTLRIKGRTEQVSESGRPSTEEAAAAVETKPEPAKLTESAEAEVEKAETSSTTSDGYHKASVEDEEDVSMSGGIPTPSISSVATEQPSAATATATATEQQVTKTETPSAPAAPQQQQQQRYWVSERSVGEFSRTFNFPTRVDQENVKASLKNGVLSVSVPKASAPTTRRIEIQ